MLFTKPARAGRVKTRLIGDLTAGQAAELHAAFLADLLARLDGGRFELWVAWALEPDDTDEAVPAPPAPAIRALRQEGADLGERLHRALAEASRDGAAVAALGSDHPTLPQALVERAFDRVEAGADAVVGPAEDGGYYLIALAPRAVVPELFAGIAWSTDRVLAATLDRCRALGLAVELLPTACDVDTPADLARLAGAMAEDTGGDLGCPATRGLLAAWGLLPAGGDGAGPAWPEHATGSAAGVHTKERRRATPDRPGHAERAR